MSDFDSSSGWDRRVTEKQCQDEVLLLADQEINILKVKPYNHLTTNHRESYRMEDHQSIFSSALIGTLTSTQETVERLLAEGINENDKDKVTRAYQIARFFAIESCPDYLRPLQKAFEVLRSSSRLALGAIKVPEFLACSTVEKFEIIQQFYKDPSPEIQNIHTLLQKELDDSEI